MKKSAVSESPGFFVPVVKVTRSGSGEIDVKVSASANNSCFRATGWALELPPGMHAKIPEHAHLVCKAQYTGRVDRYCLMAVTRLHWHCQSLDLGTGISKLVVHVVIGDALLGSAIVDVGAYESA